MTGVDLFLGIVGFFLPLMGLFYIAQVMTTAYNKEGKKGDGDDDTKPRGHHPNAP